MTSTKAASDSKQRQERHLVVVLVIASLAILTGLGNGTFWEPDEPRFAEATRQMFQRGDFVTPYLNDVPRFEKPILFYWAQAAAFTAFGANEFAARLPSALAGIGIVLVLYLLGAEIASRRAGLVGALILSTMFRFVTFARIGLTDVPVMFFIVAALYGFVRAVHRRSTLFLGVVMCRPWNADQRSRRPPAGCHLGVCGVQPRLVAVRARATDRRDDGRTRDCLALVCLDGGPAWPCVHGLCAGPRNRRRMISEDAFAPTRGFFYYFKVWPGDAAPWSALFVASVGWIAWRWSSLDNATRQSIVFAASWFIAVFLLFSLSRSKVPHYVLPAYPAAALVIGVFVDRLADTRDDARWWGVPIDDYRSRARSSPLRRRDFSLTFWRLVTRRRSGWRAGVLAAGAAAIAAATWKRTLVPAVYALTFMLAAVFAVIGAFIVPHVIEPFKPMPLLARQAAEYSQRRCADWLAWAIRPLQPLSTTRDATSWRSTAMTQPSRSCRRILVRCA